MTPKCMYCKRHADQRAGYSPKLSGGGVVMYICNKCKKKIQDNAKKETEK